MSSFCQRFIPAAPRIYLALVVTILFMASSSSSLAAPGDLLWTLHSPLTNAQPRFGASVAIEDDRILVGNPRTSQSGLVDLFDATTGAFLHTFAAPSPLNNNNYGNEVAFLNGDILINERHGNRPGLVHRYDATTFELKHTFVSPVTAGNNSFGSAIAVVPGTNLLAIGELGALVPSLPDRVGAIHLFDTTTNQFVRTIGNPNIQIVGNPGDSRFGDEIAAGDGFLAAGDESFREPADPGFIRGISYIFDPESGELQHSLRLPNEFSAYYGGSQLGRKVAADGDTLAVSDGGQFMFLFDALNGQLESIFLRSTFASGTDSLALDGEILYYGADNSGDVFAMRGPTCCLPVLSLSGVNSGFGRSLAIEDGILVVGDNGMVQVYQTFPAAVPEPTVFHLAFAGVLALACCRFRGVTHHRPLLLRKRCV